MGKIEMRLKELSETDFWNNKRYYLTDGETYISLEEFLEFKKKGSRVFVETDTDNVFDMAFWIMDEIGKFHIFLGDFNGE